MFICIGNEKIIGDSLGPRCGTIIKKCGFENKIIEVIGTKEYPLGYCELYRKKDYINKNVNKKIVIDSALGSSKNVGKVLISKNSFIAGNGINKGLKINAEIILQGIVGNNYDNIEQNKIELAYANEKTVNLVMKKILKILPEIV